MKEETPSGPAARRQHIVDAAIGVFLRYGYRRTTMADIAEAAGLTRPTLYLTFPDKEKVFKAVIDTMVANKLTAIRQGLARRASLAAKLRFACEAWGAEGFELVRANPDAKDMFDFGFPPVREGCLAFEELIAGILSEPLRHTELKIAARQLARAIVFGMTGFKHIARDGQEMRQLIDTQIGVVSAALNLAAERRADADGETPNDAP
ncbi:hypothetical protein GCM10023144_21160 [Pigmentiphaga soli]|uniref:HTH tetR-type domain-containing protein n=1 Tax=Pigmentiphaga soli TaxID=1007095 RepID=A0ABP8GYT2_9BURK